MRLVALLGLQCQLQRRGGFLCNSSADLVLKQKKWSSQTVLFDAFSFILEAIDTAGKGGCETLKS